MDNNASARRKDNKGGNRKTVLRELGFRWVLTAFVVLLFFLEYQNAKYDFAFFQTLAIALIYNSFITYHTFKSYDGYKRFANIIIILDILLVSVISYYTGGVSSELYPLFFFIVACSAVKDYSFSAFIVSFISVLMYSAASLLASIHDTGGMFYWKLGIRNMIIFMAAIGLSVISHEMKKYNELHKKEFKLARTDKLTGLANRHYFDQKLGEELEYAEYCGKPLNILLFDLDNFKKFNDTYGHTWGDKLLMLFSDIIKQSLRSTDIPVRYGGEEFLVLIRELDIQTAKSIGDRIRKQLEKQRIYIGNDGERKRVTVSCGVSQFPRHSTNIKQAIDCADKALYHAKAIGKNVVVTYDEVKCNEKTANLG